VLELAQTWIWHTPWKMNTQNFEKPKQKIHDIWHDQPKGVAFFAKMKFFTKFYRKFCKCKASSLCREKEKLCHKLD
jgi:hypothetical protein